MKSTMNLKHRYLHQETQAFWETPDIEGKQWLSLTKFENTVGSFVEGSSAFYLLQSFIDLSFLNKNVMFLQLRSLSSSRSYAAYIYDFVKTRKFGGQAHVSSLKREFRGKWTNVEYFL